ncbi:MAG: condensation domain-containing protein, partial [Pyrinomonadaceae bacterium]
MSDFSKGIESLSPEKRSLLDLMLKKKGAEFNTFPLSFAQQRLWFLYQMEPDSAVYNIPAAVRLNGLIDVSVLERTLNAIIERHESLRTSFALINGQPVQIISRAQSFTLPLVDLSELDGAERDAEARRLATEEAQRPFNLTQGPLLRATLLRLGEQEHVVLLTMHHIVSDGWSMGVLIKEVGALYEAFSTGKSSPLPELPIQYADYAVWQQQWLQGETLNTQLDYWKQQLADAPSTIELPTDHQRPASQSFRGAQESLQLTREVSEGLRRLSHEHGTTLFMTLLAAFQCLLYRYSGQEDVVVGSPIAGRTRAEVEGLIGFFVNTSVLRTKVRGDDGFRELMRQVREVCVGAYTHQEVPFEKLVEELQPSRDLSRHPLFQVMFVLQNAGQETLELPKVKLSSMEANNGAAVFDLTLSMIEVGEMLAGTIEYSTDLFERETILRIIGHFHTLLHGIVSEPDLPLSHLPLLTHAERHQLLLQWNDTRSPFPSHL